MTSSSTLISSLVAAASTPKAGPSPESERSREVLLSLSPLLLVATWLCTRPPFGEGIAFFRRLHRA